MKKIVSLIIGLVLVSSAALASHHHHLKNHVVKQDDPPNSVSGAFNFYNADRNPTANEPSILAGLLVPQQILMWKNTATGVLFFLKSATDNGDGTYTLTWVQFTFENIN